MINQYAINLQHGCPDKSHEILMFPCLQKEAKQCPNIPVIFFDTIAKMLEVFYQFGAIVYPLPTEIQSKKEKNF